MFIVTKGTKWCLLKTFVKGESRYRWSKVQRTMWARRDDAWKALEFVTLVKGQKYVAGAKVGSFLEMPSEAVERPVRARRMPTHRRPGRRRLRRSGFDRLMRAVGSARQTAPQAPDEVVWTPSSSIPMVGPIRFNNAPLAYDIEFGGFRPLDAPQNASEGGQ